jgi:hypothetical protein
VLVTPLILCFSLPACASRILAFVKSHHRTVEGVGSVCDYSLFDLDRCGSRRYGGRGPAEGGTEEEVDGAGEGEGEGKLEKSVLTFYLNYPEWQAGPQVHRMLARWRAAWEEGGEGGPSAWVRGGQGGREGGAGAGTRRPEGVRGAAEERVEGDAGGGVGDAIEGTAHAGAGGKETVPPCQCASSPPFLPSTGLVPPTAQWCPYPFYPPPRSHPSGLRNGMNDGWGHSSGMWASASAMEGSIGAGALGLAGGWGGEGWEGRGWQAAEMERMFYWLESYAARGRTREEGGWDSREERAEGGGRAGGEGKGVVKPRRPPREGEEAGRGRELVGRGVSAV